MTPLEKFSTVFYFFVLVFCISATVVTAVSLRKCGMSGRMCFPPFCLTFFCWSAISVACFIMGNPLSGNYVMHLAFAMTPIFLPRLSFGKGRKSIFPTMAIVMAVVAVLFPCLFRPQWWLDRWIPALMTAVLVFFVGRTILRQIDGTGRYGWVVSAREWLPYLVDLLYYMSIVLMAIIGNTVGRTPSLETGIFTSVCTLFLIAILVALRLRLRDGRAFLLLHSREEVFLGNMNPDIQYGDNEDGDFAMEIIFMRLKEYFEKNKPFLDPELKMTDVARTLLTNKVYLSRAINEFTGKNFCQFVNFYRVKYAVRLFNGNNAYKVTDLAVKSGFHTERSFTMAFRLYMNISPSCWCRLNRGKSGAKVLQN